MLPLFRSGSSAGLPLRSDTRRKIFSVLVFLEFASLLIALLIPQRAEDLHNAYGQLLIAALAGFYLAETELPRGREQRVFLAFLLWLLISRWLNRDFYLFLDRPLLIDNLLALLLLAAGALPDARQRQRLLTALTVVYAGFFVLAAALALFVVLTGTYLHIPPENIWITLLPRNRMSNGVRAINVLSTHRLTTAPRLYMAWCLLLHQLLRRRKKLWAVPLCLGMLILHLTIALCYSRNVRICFSVSCAMLALLAAYRRLRPSLGPKRLIALVLLPLLCLPLAYKSFDLCTAVLGKLRSELCPRYELAYRASDRHLDPEYFGLETTSDAQTPSPAEKEDSGQPGREPDGSAAADENDLFTDARSLAGNKTLTGRTKIWKSILPCIREKPSILLYGQPSKEIMPLANKYIPSKEYKAHMHNMFAQCLMLTGLPGVLLLAAWCVLLAVKMIRFFFCRSESVPFASAFLTIPLTGMLLFNMAEVLITTNYDVASDLFFLLAGIFLAEYDERFPRREAAA